MTISVKSKSFMTILEKCDSFMHNFEKACNETCESD